jgi:hypothetical protein
MHPPRVADALQFADALIEQSVGGNLGDWFQPVTLTMG